MSMMKKLTISAAFVGTLSSGAMFGFFYAWYCSTLWGLDLLPGEVAISAMNSMNSIVRNFSFAPAFFGTPIYMMIAAILAYFTDNRNSAILLLAAAIVYGLGCVVLTASVNVPMNEALGRLDPYSVAQPDQVWMAYSSSWKIWNIIRMIFAGITLLLGMSAIYQLYRKK